MKAKTAVFEDLKVPSIYTKNVQATGTGTDSVIVVSGTKGPRVTYTGGHSRIGELIGRAVYEAVVEKVAKEHGREAREPFINTDQGDLLLFVFLIAGTIGGFAAGYYWKDLTTKADK